VELSVYNITGQEVAKLVNDMNKRTGTYTYIWDGAYNNGCMAPSGFYFCKLKTVVGEEVFEESNKILIVR
jgi:flagellar hook assembly protein FlgD